LGKWVYTCTAAKDNLYIPSATMSMYPTPTHLRLEWDEVEHQIGAPEWGRGPQGQKMMV